MLAVPMRVVEEMEEVRTVIVLAGRVDVTVEVPCVTPAAEQAACENR
jgi:hypothetical protein